MFLNLRKFDQIYLYRPFADFRKGIYGLTSIVQEEMELNPFGRYLFIFCNRSRDRLKILYWDNTGFALWYKMLEKDRFRWPSHLESESISVNSKKLEQFLTGLNPWQTPHKKLNYNQI